MRREQLPEGASVMSDPPLILNLTCVILGKTSLGKSLQRSGVGPGMLQKALIERRVSNNNTRALALRHTGLKDDPEVS